MSHNYTTHSALSIPQEKSDIAIRVTNLSKRYEIYDTPRVRQGVFESPLIVALFFYEKLVYSTKVRFYQFCPI